MSWGDLKKSYAAGADAYRVVIAVVITLFIVVERYTRRRNGET